MADDLIEHDAAPDADADDAHDAAARLGLIGHGVYYLLLALLTVRLAGGSSQNADATGAIATVAQQPFGQLLLGALTLAFAAYAIHRLASAIRGDELAERAEDAARAVVWTGLTLLAASSLLQGLGSGGGGSSSGGGQGITSTVLGWPGGQFIVGTVGLILAGVAVRQFSHAFGDALTDELHDLGITGRKLAERLGRAGYTGRGVAYGAVAVFVLHSAWTHDPEAGKGLDGALQQVREAPYGAFLLLAVAAGFAAFGVFRLVEARFAEDAEETD